MLKATLAGLALVTVLGACGDRGASADSTPADTVMPLPTTQAPMAMSDSAPDSLAATKSDSGRAKTNTKTKTKSGGPQPF